MMRALFLLLLRQGPDAHYAGGASSKTAGATTALAGQFFRFLFSTVPQWIQLAGIFIGVPVAAIVAWQAWKHRRRLRAWWVSRRRRIQVAIVSAAVIVVAAGAFSGLYGYNYVMHQNDFCQSCHIMDVPWNRFQVSAHKTLQCHACHRQPLYVSSVELFWWVTERLMTVPPHDKVPSAVCKECHMRPGTDSARTLVTLTAGHAVHLKSDSSALRNVECVTCHGRDFHVFTPNNATCAQSGCHTQTRVNLGAMSGKGFVHCTLCHDFERRVDTAATLANAKVKLVPQAVSCTKCHAMSDKMRGYDLAADPHKGNCGACHDAHKQTQPRDAYKTCATSQCHGAPDTLTAFHRGLGGHALNQCGACHQAHSWKVKGTDCLACHKTIFQDRPAARRVRTTGSLLRPISHRQSRRRRSAARGTVAAVSFARFARFAPRVALRQGGQQTQASDSVFLHSRHKSVACTECHGTSTTHGGLKFTTPQGCVACHHSARQRAQCSACHSAASLSQGLAVRGQDSTFLHSTHKSVPCLSCHGTSTTHGGLKFAALDGCLGCHHGAQQRASCTTCHATQTLGQRAVSVSFLITPPRQPVTRTLAFAHSRHAELACARCHANDITQSPTATCASCHADHHGAQSDCAACHPTARAGHDRTVHTGCANCHTDARVVALQTSRPVCLVCHQEQRNHYPNGECATCHALTAHDAVSGAGSGSGR